MGKKLKQWHEITTDELRQRIKQKGGPLHMVDDFDELLITADEHGIHFISHDDKANDQAKAEEAAR